MHPSMPVAGTNLYSLASCIKDTQHTVIFSYLLIEMSPCFIALFFFYKTKNYSLSKDSHEFFPDEEIKYTL